jgi:hypothetical protein
MELHDTVRGRDIRKIAQLLSEGADPNIQNWPYGTALHAAVDVAESKEIVPVLSIVQFNSIWSFELN